MPTEPTGKQVASVKGMPTRSHRGTGGVVFHVMNRGARRGRLFEVAEDYAAFLRVMCDAQARVVIRVLCFILMPNHWHLVVWPERDQDLSHYMQWLTATHALRWHLARGSMGTGAVYQGRFRAIPIRHDGHLLTACQYVERNALRAGLVSRAEDWPWSSAWPRSEPGPRPLLAPWPVERPACWSDWLNRRDLDRDVDRLRDAIRRQVPFGETEWSAGTAAALGLMAGLRGRGRPRDGDDG
jgi:putative transposase